MRPQGVRGRPQGRPKKPKVGPKSVARGIGAVRGARSESNLIKQHRTSAMLWPLGRGTKPAILLPVPGAARFVPPERTAPRRRWHPLSIFFASDLLPDEKSVAAAASAAAVASAAACSCCGHRR